MGGPPRRTSCLVAESPGFTGLGAPSFPSFPVSPLPGQCINSQPWLPALTHCVAPLMRGRPGRRRCRARATGLSVPALGAGRAVPRSPCPSACPAPVPCSFWRAWGGAVRSRFPPTWLGVVGVAEGRLRGGCLSLLRGASGVRRSPSPDCPPTGRAVGVRYPRAVGAGVRVWGPFSVPLVCTPRGGCAPRGRFVAFVCRGAGLGGGAGRAPCPLFVRPGGGL